MINHLLHLQECTSLKTRYAQHRPGFLFEKEVERAPGEAEISTIASWRVKLAWVTNTKPDVTFSSSQIKPSELNRVRTRLI